MPNDTPSPPPPRAAIDPDVLRDFQQRAVQQQADAMAILAAKIAPEAVPVEWAAVREGHRLLVTEGGKRLGGAVYYAKGTRRPAHVVVQLAADLADAPRCALWALHETAHLLQAKIEGGEFLEGDSHERPSWKEACEVLTFRAFATTAVAPVMLGRSWPMDVAAVAGWRPPLQEAARTMLAVAGNFGGPPFPMKQIHAAADALEEFFVAGVEARSAVLAGLLRA